MGFDIYALNGLYFRASGFDWRRLWMFSCEIAKDRLTKEDMRMGFSNDSYTITQKKAYIIGRRLLEAERNKEKWVSFLGKTRRWMVKAQKEIVMQIWCDDQEGLEEHLKEASSKCDYSFRWSFTHKFAVFCIKSKGFTIC